MIIIKGWPFRSNYSFGVLNTVLVVLLIGLFDSCSNREKIQFYKNGNIKQKDFYSKYKLDSTSIYFEDKQNLIKERRIYQDSLIMVYKFAPTGQLTIKGTELRSNNLKMGKWIYSDYQTNMDSIVEYVPIKNNSHVNQIWIQTFEKDTILGRGNYFEIIKKDTISSDELFRVRFILMEPFIGSDSEVVIVIPKNDAELEDDFSNLFRIDRDTIKSLKNDGIIRSEIPNGLAINHFVDFGINFEETGEQKIRGALIEYQYLDDSTMTKMNINRNEHRLFFNSTVYVKN